MTWTTERPTQPGWYWLRDPDGIVGVVQVVLEDYNYRLNRNMPTLYLLLPPECIYSDGETVELVAFDSHQHVTWAGPMATPE